MTPSTCHFIRVQWESRQYLGTAAHFQFQIRSPRGAEKNAEDCFTLGGSVNTSCYEEITDTSCDPDLHVETLVSCSQQKSETR